MGSVISGSLRDLAVSFLEGRRTGSWISGRCWISVVVSRGLEEPGEVEVFGGRLKWPWKKPRPFSDSEFSRELELPSLERSTKDHGLDWKKIRVRDCYPKS